MILNTDRSGSVVKTSSSVSISMYDDARHRGRTRRRVCGATGEDRCPEEEVVQPGEAQGCSERIVSYADSNGFISLKGHGCSALVRHEKRVELPEDKGPITDALHSHGLYDRYSMPNWARIRAEIAKGTMHHDIADMAEVSGNPKVYFKRETGGRK